MKPERVILWLTGIKTKNILCRIVSDRKRKIGLQKLIDFFPQKIHEMQMEGKLYPRSLYCRIFSILILRNTTCML